MVAGSASTSPTLVALAVEEAEEVCNSAVSPAHLLINASQDTVEVPVVTAVEVEATVVTVEVTVVSLLCTQATNQSLNPFKTPATSKVVEVAASKEATSSNNPTAAAPATAEATVVTASSTKWYVCS